MKINDGIVSGSYKDLSGHLFFKDKILYRQVNFSYQENYDFLIDSGLYELLSKSNRLVSHIEIDNSDKGIYKLLQPTLVNTFSYPYEWSFSQLKDAALLTLNIQREALLKGMILKDASSYNVTFHQGEATFIDTLSFERYRDGEPWVAYKQFCQHFLAPLVLMSKRDIRLNSLLRSYIDGVPLDLASSLLPTTSFFNLGIFLHVYLHAISQKKYSETSDTKKIVNTHISKSRLVALIDSLESTIKKLKWSPGGTEWDDYYINNNNYNDLSMADKEKKIESLLSQIKPSTVWDLGANFGNFSRIASKYSENVIAWDIDPSCVERNYLRLKKAKGNITPLLIDLTNPSPSIGWNCEERMSFFERDEPDAVLALGLVHHLAISNNTPFSYIFKFLSKLSKNVVIEFIPKSDSQVIKLLSSREDIFKNYTQEGFEMAFLNFFKLVSVEKIKDSERSIYYLKRI
jgi:ribosomal protein L11 methylase PrmA